MPSSLRGFFLAVICSLATFGWCQDGIEIFPTLKQQAGWGRDGWGGIDFKFTTGLGYIAKAKSWTAHWEVNGKQVGDAWGGDLSFELPRMGTFHHEEVGVLPGSILDAAKGSAPKIVGTFTFVHPKGDLMTVPYEVSVPEAKLPEPLKTITGKTVAISLMKSRFDNFKTSKRALKWIDECYQAMIEFTGEQPFGGKIMVYTEAPEHPWWAYAGQKMILNTKYVGKTVKDLDEGILSFGWIHEVGHNFDEKIGDWYIWNGPAAEFQANFKLAYAVSNIEDQSFRIRWKIGAPDYVPVESESVISGKHLVESFFLPFGDKYLSDPSRDWQSMTSDDIHSMFQRLQVVYGWKPFKRWYRTYRLLQDSGMKPPDKPEDKINLAVAILSKETGNDLLPVFQMWRFPVSASKVGEMKVRYLSNRP